MISVVVLTKNEEKNLERCLKSLQWCDERVVIDDFSLDGTLAVVQKFGAKIYQRALNNNFASQRNFGLQKAKGDWVLFVDADEVISPALANEIKLALSKSAKNGFYFKRRDYFGGRWLKYGETAKVKFLRLAKKKAGKWQRKVHETWKIKGEAGELTQPILHFPHPTISEFLSQINYFSTLHAEALFEQKIKFKAWQIIFYPLGKFLQNYFLRLGFLDGTPGLILALMMSLHSFLARGKLYFK